MLSTSLSFSGGAPVLLLWFRDEVGELVLVKLFREGKELLSDPECVDAEAALRGAPEGAVVVKERFEGAERVIDGFVDVTGLNL